MQFSGLVGQLSAIGCPLTDERLSVFPKARGQRVLKIDGAFAPRVLKFDTACGCEGCGGRLSAMSIKCCLRQRPPLVPYGTNFHLLKRWDYGRWAMCCMSLRRSIERPILPPGGVASELGS